MCVFLYSCLSHPAWKSHIFRFVLYSYRLPVWLYHLFTHYLITGTIFGGSNLLNIKCFSIFPRTFLISPRTFLIFRRNFLFFQELFWFSQELFWFYQELFYFPKNFWFSQELFWFSQELFDFPNNLFFIFPRNFDFPKNFLIFPRTFPWYIPRCKKNRARCSYKCA